MMLFLTFLFEVRLQYICQRESFILLGFVVVHVNENILIVML